jgi:hypothetical protein
MFLSTYQVFPESFHHMPHVPIIQSLSNLRVIVVRSAPNLLRGQGVAAHRGVVVGHDVGGVRWWFMVEFKLGMSINFMCADCRIELC